MRSAKNILKHELIGLDVEVVGAGNKSLVGIKGTVVDETKNTLIIETAKGEKIVLKGNVELKLRIDGEEIIINGENLVGRPEDRIKK